MKDELIDYDPYEVITLTTREVNCETLNKEDFINFLLEDIKTASQEYNKLTNGGDIKFFDFDVEPWKNGILTECILNVNNISEKTIEKCYDKIKNNKFFTSALGWKLEYTGRKINKRSCFRPFVKLILTEENQQKWDNDYQNLITESIISVHI